MVARKQNLPKNAEIFLKEMNDNIDMITIHIKQIMKEKHLTVKQLAKKTGISERTIYHIYEEVKCPTLEELEWFAEALGVYIEDLYDSTYSKKKLHNLAKDLHDRHN